MNIAKILNQNNHRADIDDRLYAINKELSKPESSYVSTGYIREKLNGILSIINSLEEVTKAETNEQLYSRQQDLYGGVTKRRA